MIKNHQMRWEYQRYEISILSTLSGRLPEPPISSPVQLVSVGLSIQLPEISRLPCYVFCICMLTNKYQKYKSVELGDQLKRYEKAIFFFILIASSELVRPILPPIEWCVTRALRRTGPKRDGCEPSSEPSAANASNSWATLTISWLISMLSICWGLSCCWCEGHRLIGQLHIKLLATL